MHREIVCCLIPSIRAAQAVQVAPCLQLNQVPHPKPGAGILCVEIAGLLRVGWYISLWHCIERKMLDGDVQDVNKDINTFLSLLDQCI